MAARHPRNDNAPATGQKYSILAKPDHTNDDTYTIVYHPVDAHSQAEAPKTGLVKLDTRAPVTAFAVSAAGSALQGSARSITYSGSRTVNLRAKDVDLKNHPASGVRTAHYKIYSGSWRTGTPFMLRAPSRGKKKFVVRCYSTDKLGHKGATRSKTFYVAAR